jgi:hypothetical protein
MIVSNGGGTKYVSDSCQCLEGEGEGEGSVAPRTSIFRSRNVEVQEGVVSSWGLLLSNAVVKEY